jgi:hypothetical protein
LRDFELDWHGLAGLHQQMGDYSRDFANEDDAKIWANSYKGEAIKIHVDPRDPTRSVLREEDLYPSLFRRSFQKGAGRATGNWR